MPMNEARGYQRSNLSPAQRAEQLAAIYGLSPKEKDPTMNQQYSPDQLQMMRDILAQQEGQSQHVGIKEFDLNNPPKAPYKYQEFPRAVYHHAKRKHQLAESQAELQAALEAGWSKEPFLAEEPEPTLDAAEQAEIAALDKQLRSKKR